MRILVVEDDPLQREVMRRELAAVGHDVLAVGDAEVAMVAHAQTPFSLVVADWLLPGIDGLRLVQRIRAQPGGEAVFTLVVTARDRPEDLQRVLDSGADDYMAKPVDAAALLTRVRIAERRLARQKLHDVDREALLRTQAEFRRVIERCPLGVIARHGSTVLYANGASARILGVSRQELVGASFLDFVAPEFRDVMERRAQRFDRSGAPPPPIEVILVRPDGRRIVARQIPVTRASFEGTDVSYIMIEDVTARTHAERRLRMTQFAVDRAGELVLWVESGGTITYANAAANELLGFAPATLSGRRLADLDADLDVAGWEPWLARLVALGTIRYDTRLRDRSGRMVAVEVSANALQFDGETFVVLSARDVRERESLRANLQRAERLASVGSLAAGVAHEINNPLAYVLANLELLQEAMAKSTLDPGARERMTELLDGCLDGAGRVRRIVADLRSFARQRDDDAGPCDVHRVLDTAIGIADNHIRHRARLVRAYGAPATVTAHEGRLSQVFVNLLVNAAQAIPEAGRDDHAITVVTTSPEPGWVAISISDTGVGIEESLLERIFEPFFTTKPQGEGTGLGLSVCHGIVMSLGGRLEVQSRVGVGSTFRVLLPLAVGGRVARGESADERSEGTPGGLRILVVDDEAMIGESVRKALAEQQVTVVHSGGEAIAACDRVAFDLVLCDLMMPGISGIDVYETVRQRHPDQAARFVFMTGGAFTPKAKAFLDRYGGEWMAKPFALSELRALVARWARRLGAATGS
ncbi:MAG: response regulator [Nannocystaceae bacterium]|nr:response regulator [Nannocystaceae bacterium]